MVAADDEPELAPLFAKPALASDSLQVASVVGAFVPFTSHVKVTSFSIIGKAVVDVTLALTRNCTVLMLAASAGRSDIVNVNALAVEPKE